MGVDDNNWAARRRKMVRDQLQGRGIRDPRVLEAMSELPRQQFIPEDSRDLAYDDRPVSIGEGQTISQPYIVALMTQELGVGAEQRVLEVGAGSGYQTAILARLARQVCAIERIEVLSRRALDVLAQLRIANVTWKTGDGTQGWPEHAPFDRILCAAAGPDVPAAWLEQLAEGGRIVMPVGDTELQTLIAVEKERGQFHRREICGVRFVRLIGRDAWPEEM